jgi:23S rRNA (cytosine1962-C5)-methyltransferase
MKTSDIFTTGASQGYELLDSGEGEKLERFGEFTLSRPDPQALWPKRLDESVWKKADAYFTRDAAGADWSFRRELPPKWAVDFAGLKFWIRTSSFKHTGLFPEQAANWEWLKKQVAGKNDVEVLNLFGYTGGATLVCAQAGAKVVHIDGSKAAVAWARENAELSGLADKPIRWIIEDARLFVERELRRSRAYDGIIMDPPAFGHGPDNELWKIEEHFLPLIEDCKKLLKPKPLFFLVNGYSAGYSAIAYENNLLPLKEKFGGGIEIGELAIEESSKGKEEERLLPAGIFARWSAN